MSRRRETEQILPPLDQGVEVLDGAPIFDEFSADEALVLWKTVRAVRLWARVPPEERGEAFEPGAYEQRLELLRESIASKALLGELETLAGVLTGERADEAAVAAACVRVSEWAEERGSIGTAIEFMQGAAFTTPMDASLARNVGLLARKRGEYARAETWYRKAIATGRRTRNWNAFTLSYIGLGNVYMFRGNYPAARKATLRALHAAKRHSARELTAMAYHDLAAISSRTGKALDLRRYARAALDAYGKGHPRLPSLAHDVGVFWLEQGYFVQALEVFRAIPADYGNPLDRLMRAAGTARAAGALRDHAVYATAAREADRLLALPAAAQGIANALVNLARAAESIGHLADAREYAERAHRVALARGEAECALEAEMLLESTRAEGASRHTPAPAPKNAPRHITALASELVAAVGG